jgi:hypothetical protein
MSTPTWATQMATAITESTPRQVGAVPLVYPLLEALRVRETINALRRSKADIDLGRLVEVLLLNRLRRTTRSMPSFGASVKLNGRTPNWTTGRASLCALSWRVAPLSRHLRRPDLCGSGLGRVECGQATLG